MSSGAPPCTPGNYSTCSNKGSSTASAGAGAPPARRRSNRSQSGDSVNSGHRDRRIGGPAGGSFTRTSQQTIAQETSGDRFFKNDIPRSRKSSVSSNHSQATSNCSSTFGRDSSHTRPHDSYLCWESAFSTSCAAEAAAVENYPHMRSDRSFFVEGIHATEDNLPDQGAGAAAGTTTSRTTPGDDLRRGNRGNEITIANATSSASMKVQDTSEKSNEIRVAVLGAGISGLHVAERLKSMSRMLIENENPFAVNKNQRKTAIKMPRISVIIFEKANACGGRLVTRHTRAPDPTGYQFDFGAPFFRVKHPHFHAWLQRTCGLGKFPSGGFDRQISQDWMQTVAFERNSSQGKEKSAELKDVGLQTGRWGLPKDHEPRWGVNNKERTRTHSQEVAEKEKENNNKKRMLKDRESASSPAGDEDGESSTTSDVGNTSASQGGQSSDKGENPGSDRDAAGYNWASTASKLRSVIEEEAPRDEVGAVEWRNGKNPILYDCWCYDVDFLNIDRKSGGAPACARSRVASAADEDCKIDKGKVKNNNMIPEERTSDEIAATHELECGLYALKEFNRKEELLAEMKTSTAASGAAPGGKMSNGTTLLATTPTSSKNDVDLCSGVEKKSSPRNGGDDRKEGQGQGTTSRDNKNAEDEDRNKASAAAKVSSPRENHLKSSPRGNNHLKTHQNRDEVQGEDLISREQMYGQTGSERELQDNRVFVGWPKMSELGKMVAKRNKLDVRLGCRIGKLFPVKTKPNSRAGQLHLLEGGQSSSKDTTPVNHNTTGGNQNLSVLVKKQHLQLTESPVPYTTPSLQNTNSTPLPQDPTRTSHGPDGSSSPDDESEVARNVGAGRQTSGVLSENLSISASSRQVSESILDKLYTPSPSPRVRVDTSKNVNSSTGEGPLFDDMPSLLGGEDTNPNPSLRREITPPGGTVSTAPSKAAPPSTLHLKPHPKQSGHQVVSTQLPPHAEHENEGNNKFPFDPDVRFVEASALPSNQEAQLYSRFATGDMHDPNCPEEDDPAVPLMIRERERKEQERLQQLLGGAGGTDGDTEGGARGGVRGEIDPMRKIDSARRPPPPRKGEVRKKENNPDQERLQGVNLQWDLRKVKHARLPYNAVTNPANAPVSSRPFDYVVVSLPGPQTMQLVEELPIMKKFPRIQAKSKMRGCYVLMLGFSIPASLNETEIPSTIDCVAHPVVRCVIIDSNKPGRVAKRNRIGLKTISVCVFASFEWSEQHFIMEEQMGAGNDYTYRGANVIKPMLKEARELLLSANVPIPENKDYARPKIDFWKYMFDMRRLEYTDLHAWRYAQVIGRPGKAGANRGAEKQDYCWLDKEHKLGICGDWASGCATVEGAWWSAEMLADQMQACIADQYGENLQEMLAEHDEDRE
ncbi:unnamed protein product [Amoebophrya sp. A120]|nr:unnamed protein product [Amoebophrya sp. A120]|eukprot:GSA120T00019334001.1